MLAQLELVSSAMFTPLWVQSLTLLGNNWNGPLWQVSAFAFCYAAFPRLLSRFLPQTATELRNSALRWFLVGAVLSVMGWLIMPSAAHAFFALRIPQFAVGICAGLWANRAQLASPTLSAELCTLVLVACFVVTPVVAAANPPAYGMTFFIEFWVTPVHALWIVALTSPDCRGPTRQFLLSKPLQALGTISYTTYCLHWPTLIWCAWAVAGNGVSASAVPRHQYPHSDVGWFYFRPQATPALLAVCLAVGAAMYYAVEKPARGFITRRFGL